MSVYTYYLKPHSKQNRTDDSLVEIDSIWGGSDRRIIYRNISTNNPEILFNVIANINRQRRILGIKPEEKSRENDLSDIAGFFSIDKSLSFYHGRLVEFLYRFDKELNREFCDEICSIFIDTLPSRVQLLLDQDWAGIDDLDERVYNKQRVSFISPVIRRDYEKWLYVQSLFCFGYLLRLHTFSCKMLNALNISGLAEFNEAENSMAFDLYYKNTQTLVDVLDVNEFSLIKYYSLSLLDNSRISKYIEYMVVDGVDYYKELENKVLSSLYSRRHMYGFIEENYVYEGRLDFLYNLNSHDKSAKTIAYILNAIIISECATNNWSQLMYCETYINSYKKYYKRNKNVTANNIVHNKKKINKQSSIFKSIDNREELGHLSFEDEIDINNMELDSGFFEYLSKK